MIDFQIILIINKEKIQIIIFKKTKIYLNNKLV